MRKACLGTASQPTALPGMAKSSSLCGTAQGFLPGPQQRLPAVVPWAPAVVGRTDRRGEGGVVERKMEERENVRTGSGRLLASIRRDKLIDRTTT